MKSSTAVQPGAPESKLLADFVAHALAAGDAAEAERLLRDWLLKFPLDADALGTLAQIAAGGGRVEEAGLLFRRAAEADRSPERFVSLIAHLQAHAGPEAVLKAIETAPPPIRTADAVLLAEAAALGMLGGHEREIEIYEGVLRSHPEDATLWKSLGDALKTVGRLDEAVAALREAIRRRPTFGEAYWTLANLKTFRFDDNDIAAMRRALKKKLSDRDALHFQFALGQALENRKFYQQAFRHYAAGNAIRTASVDRSNLFVTGFVDSAISTLSKDFFEARKGWGSDARDPIFVVGLQRSGSTLIEQILASHPMIEGTTEILVMQQLWERIARSAAARRRGPFQQLADMDAKTLRDIGEEYLERTRAFRTTERPFFVDKLPANWMNVGLIRLALPNATIIDARRHPMACGFSNFKQHYAAGVLFSYSQESIGAFYRDYWRFMEHFDHVQPGAIHRVLNERLIEDPEGEIRRMVEFIGIPFDPACLEFHTNKRAVRTPSAEQVRRPINRDGMEQWRNFEPWLGELKSALGPALEQWDEPRSH